MTEERDFVLKLLQLNLIVCLIPTYIGTISFGDIYQWYDGDGDNSLWLCDNDAVPNAELNSMYLGYADLLGLNLQNASFYGSILSHANFTDCHLQNSILQYTVSESSIFTNVNLSGSNLSYSNFTAANFQNASLYGSDVSYSNFSGADFQGARLIGILDWTATTWAGATYNDDTIFSQGMNPDEMGMLYVPVPTVATLALFSIAGCTIRRRRS